MNLLKLNNNTDLMGYNCGGFALGRQEWYIPEILNVGKPVSDPDELLEEAVADIQYDCPNLRRIPHPRVVPKSKDIVGFRIAYIENDEGEYEEDDFHFILRHNHRWLHKPGISPIRRVNFHMEKEWPRACGDNYNSRIVWFVKE